ncbi:hypothetical protein E2C01_018300 [Portunus trituberculatus]|uniref:Uncharacterized protein n=1 Tax=Portunus trituberculatus TaxID=210409 RepID=A0A5B7DVR8_PORTR|nr:hypothetical protein [Portunus trituberculatus]
MGIKPPQLCSANLGKAPAPGKRCSHDGRTTEMNYLPINPEVCAHNTYSTSLSSPSYMPLEQLDHIIHTI